MKFESMASDVGTVYCQTDAEYLFNKGFGAAGLVEGQTYYDPIRKLDLRQNIMKSIEGNIQKAPSITTTTGGTYTAYSMFPAFLDPSIVDQTMFETPLVFLIKRKAVKNLKYVYNKITAKADASFLGIDAPLSEQVDTRSNGSVDIKFLYAVGRVLNQAVAGGESYMDLMAEDIRVKMASINEALENEIINGDTSTNALGFTGLISGITTNTTDLSGEDVSLEDFLTMKATIFQAKGRTDLAVTDAFTLNKIKGLLMDYQRSMPMAGSYGIPESFMFDSTNVIKSQYMPTTSGSRRILFLDTRYIFLPVLQDVTYTELGLTNDSKKYYLKWYGALVLQFEGSSGQIYGVK
jgi:hypothetical protein